MLCLFVLFVGGRRKSPLINEGPGVVYLKRGRTDRSRPDKGDGRRGEGRGRPEENVAGGTEDPFLREVGSTNPAYSEENKDNRVSSTT